MITTTAFTNAITQLKKNGEIDFFWGDNNVFYEHKGYKLPIVIRLAPHQNYDSKQHENTAYDQWATYAHMKDTGAKTPNTMNLVEASTAWFPINKPCIDYIGVALPKGDSLPEDFKSVEGLENLIVGKNILVGSGRDNIDNEDSRRSYLEKYTAKGVIETEVNNESDVNYFFDSIKYLIDQAMLN
ncbi:Uncharacterised protein [Candidatus Tiddalikarchaeum anstoanum]|nr:Uncharacterised protein [Candidatus Tiddalikarchaeum anstoanum]